MNQVPSVYKVERLLSRARSLEAKFKRGSETRYIDEAIILGRKALDICTPGHPKRSNCLDQLALHIRTRYNRLGGTESLNEAIALDREALALHPPGHPDRSWSLSNLSVHLCARYEELGGVEDLSEAIDLGREALALRPPGHPDRSISLNNLAVDLHTRYEQYGGVEDLTEAIELDRDALTLCPPEHPDRSMFLNNLSLHIWTRYEQLGRVDDLTVAIELDRDALALRPPGHPDRSVSLNNLALHLCARYEQLGGMEDLIEAIDLDRDALALHAPGHPARSISLNNLAADLHIRYEQLGGVEDLTEAIDLNRDALALRPPGHPHRPMSLNNLAMQLWTRYKQLGGMEDLSEAINLDRDTLALYSPGHPDRSTSLNNLALHLGSRYERLGRLVDLTEAIELNRNALALRPPGHPHRAIALNNLAIHLWIRYERLGGVDDLTEAIELDRDALALRPPGHPDRSMSLNNLAIRLRARYEKFGEPEDLIETIDLNRDALTLCPPGHPDRSSSLNNLANCLYVRYRQVGRIVRGPSSFLFNPFMQLGDPEDPDEIFRVYTELAHGVETVSLSDLNTAKAWVNTAESFCHSTTLLAYETALRLLVRYLAALPSLPQHLGVLKSLTSSLAVDAFSACLRNQSPTNAVELLEQGRGVFWSQLTRLRSPLEDVISRGPDGKTLANQFIRLTSLIRKALDCADQHDRVWRFNVELQRVVSNIRELPGLSRFLLPLLFSDLQRAATTGPIIIVNASNYSCDALVVFIDRNPVHIPLSVTKADVRELSSKLRTFTLRAKKSDVTRELGIVLRELWDRVVSPIVDLLLTVHPIQSRIWWCPTAEFSLLPLHAAGPYRKGERNLSSLYISSYTPTLTAPIRARRPSPSNFVAQKRFIAIGQANAIGTSKLASVGTELTSIGQHVDGLAMFTCIEGQDSCISKVADELGKNEFVHLACHGLPNRKQPFESALALYDGHFTIQRIIQCDLQNPEFAYLSACHTTVGDEESPDEVIHLASAMQFAGFRSVIGTMWAVDDAETSKITSVFYKHMVDKSGFLDHARAAYALLKTMKTVDVPLDQRILYVHIGA